MAADEESPLIGGVQDGGKKSIAINIEVIRFWGLLAGGALLGSGLFFSTYMVNFPVHDNPSSFTDKLLHGAPSDFDASQTYIYKMFHFNHTCSFLDFNPSKTVSALVIMLHTLPVMVFVICHYCRIQIQLDAKFDSLKSVTKILSPFQFLTLMYFYMVFVNSPYGEYGSPEALHNFILHYIPYMMWQMGMLCMAIQQCWFISLKGRIPISWVTPNMLWRYVQFLMVMFVIYTVFVWSFVFGHPIWDTSTQPGNAVAMGIMFVWDFASVVLPTIFAYFEMKHSDESIITFYEVSHE